jgi:nucleotide-binding universal stress UspA family protein
MIHRMINDILVCLEGSASTEAATRIAIGIARALNAQMAGLAIIDEPDIRAGAATSIGGASYKHERDDALVADAKKAADDWVALFEQRCRQAGVTARSLEIVGRPAESILTEMEAHHLTVIGRDANFRFETEAHDRRTLDTILHEAMRPVLLVPETTEPELNKTVLVAYDGSGAAKRAITSFAASGIAQGRAVHVATVDDNGVVGMEMAERGVAMFRTANVPATAHSVVSVLSNIDALFKLARDLQAGLMVMGAFTRSRLRQLFAGSVTRGLVERTEIPLYLQH